jgi:hypothetical protein
MYKLRLNGKTYTVTHDESGKAIYDPPLPDGMEDKWKKNHRDIVSSRKFPSLQTDTAWHANRGTLLSQFDGDEEWARHAEKKMRKAGKSVSSNAVYLPSLAETPCDPNAFISPQDGRAEVKRRLEAKARRMQEKAEAPKPRLSDKLTKELMGHYRQSGEAEGMSNQDLKTMVVDRHGRKD